MPLPASIADLSQTASSNSPSGGEGPITMDDYLRVYASYIAQLRDGPGFTTAVRNNVLGSAAIPAFSFVGDTNTGAWSPGADTYAISTNGAEAIRVDSSQRLMVNTQTPLGALTVAGTHAFAGNYTETSTAVTAASSTTLNCALGTVFNVAMSASITTLAFSNVPTTGRAYTMTLLLVQDATGSRTVAWPAAVKWASGTAPTLTATANRADVVSLITVNGGTTWLGFSSLNYVYP